MQPLNSVISPFISVANDFIPFPEDDCHECTFDNDEKAGRLIKVFYPLSLVISHIVSGGERDKPRFVQLELGVSPLPGLFFFRLLDHL